MSRFRWRLARALVGLPIMVDPLDGEDGAFVVIRKDRTIATIRAATFTLESSLPPLDMTGRSFEDIGKPRTTGTFSGTIAG